MSRLAESYTAELKRSWSLLVGTFVIAGVAVHSLPFYTSGLFIPELERTFGWTRAMVSASTLAVAVGMAIGAPLTARALDKFGTRPCALFSAFMMIVGYGALTSLRGIYWQYLLIWTLMGAFGLGASALAVTRLIGTWFSAARGLALGITLSGAGILAMVAPAMVSWAIETRDWRNGYLACATIILAASPMTLLFKEGPLLRKEALTAPPRSWDFLGSARFWLVALPILCVVTASTGIALHLVPLLRTYGTSAGRAAEIAGVMGAAVLVGRLAAGYLLDRIHAGLIGIGIALMAAAACGGFLMFGIQAALPSAFLIGLLLGSDFDLMSYMVARYFGLQLYGRVYGVLFAAAALLTGLSPLATGAMFDVTQSYELPLMIAAGLFLASVPLFWLIEPSAVRAVKLRPLQS